MSAKGFLTKCGTASRSVLFESSDNGGWTSLWNGLGAKFQYVNIYSELNLCSSLTSDDNFLIKPSGLLAFIFNSFFRTFIYLCIHSLLTFIIYVLHYFLWKCVKKNKKQANFFPSLWHGSFQCLFELARQIITILLCLNTIQTDSCLLSFSWITSMSKTRVLGCHVGFL